MTADRRYEPLGIETVVTSSPSTKLLSWGYTVNALGDIVSIADSLNPSFSRFFGYQRHQRFLTCAAGPWGDSGSCDPPSGGRLEWTYDRIGNRLTEVKTGTGGYSDAYLYVPNSSSGNTSVLDRIHRDGGLLRDYTFDSGGFLDLVTAGANVVDLTFDAAGQLSLTERPVANEKLTYVYDGRNYLVEAKEPAVPPCPSGPNPIFCDAFETSNLACWSGVSGGSSGGSCPWQQGGDRLTATYSSEGALYGITRYPQGQLEEKLAILRFGDRPVALWKKVGSNPASLTYLTTDHLGTPVLAMSSTGTVLWSGGFEPFGKDFTVPSAESLGMFLRLPGQWEDPFFDPSTLGVNLHYNLHRWYEPGTGRYIAPDPISVALIMAQLFHLQEESMLDPEMRPGAVAAAAQRYLGFFLGDSNLYLYVTAKPLEFSDFSGLARDCCSNPWSSCWGACIRELLPNPPWEPILLLPLPKRILPPFRVPHRESPYTSLLSVGAHYLRGHLPQSITRVMRKTGRGLSWIAKPVVVLEGTWSCVVIITCGNVCYDQPCLFR